MFKCVENGHVLNYNIKEIAIKMIFRLTVKN